MACHFSSLAISSCCFLMFACGGNANDSSGSGDGDGDGVGGTPSGGSTHVDGSGGDSMDGSTGGSAMGGSETGDGGTDSGAGGSGHSMSTHEIVERGDDNNTFEFLGVATEEPAWDQEPDVELTGCLLRDGDEGYVYFSWEVEEFVSYPSALIELNEGSCVQAESSWSPGLFGVGEWEPSVFGIPVTVPEDCADERVTITLSPQISPCDPDCSMIDQLVLDLCIETPGN